MKNLGSLMKQAQQMQTRMNEMQQKLAETEFTGSAAGGMVTVTLNGKTELQGVKIDPSLISPDEAEILEDLIIAAHNDAKAKVEDVTAEQMKSLTGGLKLPPGMSLPF
ncbi:MAG: YbaB/EbfC family nucleoid-associated protein [Rhodospirillaceae bacterium]|nr:YbaB/EbfC family nucleoid-associated protein [Rhodospirillaceae bacterium]